MTRYKLTLEYDGKNFIGWQENRQGDSVQSVLQDAIKNFSGQDVVVYSAGRTDAGVHAMGMVAHCDLSGDWDAQTVMRATNFYLNKFSVSVLNCQIVSDDFHARFSCVGREYKYVVLNRKSRPVLDAGRVWWVPHCLDISKMKLAACDLIGNHDFTSFRAADCQSNTPIKTLDSCEISQDGDKIIFTFSARSFLYHQVRNMVGTLVDIGMGKPYDIKKIFADKNRSSAGVNAPACGLYFMNARYPNND